MKQYNKHILEAINRGIKLALDDFEDEDMSMVKHDIIKSESPIANIIDFKKSYVDFNLPSGTLWRKYNLGTLKPEDAGNYYAWGETAPKEKYNFETYNHVDTKYIGVENIPELLPEDDAATYYDYRLKIPSKAQFNELLNYTERKWIKKGSNNGLMFIGKNGNEMFIPAAGYIHERCGLTSAEGNIWSSNRYTKDDSDRAAIYMYISEKHLGEIAEYDRYDGFSIRPVLNRKNK